MVVNQQKHKKKSLYYNLGIAVLSIFTKAGRNNIAYLKERNLKIFVINMYMMTLEKRHISTGSDTVK